LWPWLLGGLLVVIAAIAGLMGLRRRSVEHASHEEPALTETVAPPKPIAVAKPAPPAEREPQFLRPAPVAAAAPPVAATPVAAAPIAAADPTAAASDETAQVPTEEAELAKPAAEEVAALTAGDPPVADRPWLEFAMRPIRAGTNVDEALVEIELTVGNSGSIAAEDVRISTFMFADAPGTDDEMDRLLIERGEDSGAPAVTIKPGEGTRVDATLALPRAGLDPTKDGFVPVVVADARYRLPDGSEGRTSASFTIGVSKEGGTAMAPIQTDRALMHEDVEARLYGTPDRV
jgi:Meckel syndrome type 1 protein